jgi:hypothetical protein
MLHLLSSAGNNDELGRIGCEDYVLVDGLDGAPGIGGGSKVCEQCTTTISKGAGRVSITSWSSWAWSRRVRERKIVFAAGWSTLPE